ncbi:hypothetical protein TRFO_07816 [Tritrichomonas foetus]|uniref:alpha-L-rhamnosidase n=1 Tax=Tritrichomonas foetus TaxID=1144522 RepID=A0A1J4JP50_9EUKA|nr:hypothetical protein TRFO_07816 [Tritrichomonas foetus]|eukprot:OHT00819.1 hypothetical protein TRFO_07816 [Tritrichomonas foetus]
MSDLTYTNLTNEVKIRKFDCNIIKNEEQKFVLGKLTARYSIPVIVKEEIKPKQIIKGENGDIIIDMGKNIVGWLQFSCHNLPKNFEIVLEFGEILQNNNFFRENLRNAQQQFRYVSNGKKSVKIHPHFTFYGFQYVRLTNWPTKNVNINDFLGLSIYSDFEQIGFVKTSDSLVNKLIDNILWSQKDNFLDVPTDCPQRDERMGWTGDAQSFSGTALFNSDCYAFYRKYAHDLALMQTFNDGMVPNVVPYFGPREKLIGGKCAWGDSACIIPWNVYLFTGKKQILEEQFESMKSWVDWIKNHGNQNQNHRNSNSQTKDPIQNDFTHENNYLWYGGDLQFGDWLALNGPTHPKVNIKRTKGGTDTTFLCSAFYYYSTSLLVKAAKVLGKSEVVDKYSKLTENILNSVRNEFFSKNGRCAVDTQTAYIISLQFGLVPKSQEKVIFSQLFKLLTKKEMHLTTGFIGTPFICRAISDAGFPKYAYDVFMQTDFPGWLNQVKMGANSLWERWNSLLPNGKVNGATMNSFNHYWSGSILEWIYRNVGGIIPIEDKPGFMEFNLWPQPGSKIEEIYIKYDSPMGTIKSGWKFIDNMNVRYHFTVPFNTIGHMKLENADASECKVINGTICLKQDERNVVADLSNGKYIIQCPYVQKEFEPTAKFN